MNETNNDEYIPFSDEGKYNQWKASISKGYIWHWEVCDKNKLDCSISNNLTFETRLLLN